MAITGGCRCGDIRYTLPGDTLPRIYACHCRDCQTWSGSAFSQQALYLDGAITVTGSPELFELPHVSGRISRQQVCGRCHTRIFNTNTGRPGWMVLRAGTLDRSDELQVVAHIWTSRKQPWLVLADGVPAWPESAPPAEFIAALT